ncbi:CPBP family intramembrane metalloprotease [Duganella sp. sic0402]|uniref:CPBP family intramembrane glutamic endopeptidase n=1 Tax=Duganella sp. sic0402 TaxID=2854786 RepID=UPI001C459D99|nr:type II CAAX endopeptidase family protein [Duganella sp. sic0402]MBV7537434.1 CPBP family intramembrane metalloprotease [Duganella sp. sic0402]
MSIAHAVRPFPSFFSRLFAHPAARVVLGILATVLPITLTMLLADILVPKPLRVVWPMLLATVLSVAAYRWFVITTEKRQPSELSLHGAARETGIGVALGAALGLTVAGMLAAAGAFTITGSSDSFGFLLKSVPEQIMVAFFEEIMFRAVAFRIVEQRWGTRAALVASMLLFALAHLSNDNVSVMGIAMTCIASLVFSACYMKTRRVWLPIGAHFAWNSTYDGLFAAPVSGHAARGWLQVSTSGPEWLTGGSYGVEASVVTLVVWGVVAVLMLRQRPANVLAH